MAKPRLVKVRALFYVLQHITKRGYAYFDTASLGDKKSIKNPSIPYSFGKNILILRKRT